MWWRTGCPGRAVGSSQDKCRPSCRSVHGSSCRTRGGRNGAVRGGGRGRGRARRSCVRPAPPCVPTCSPLSIALSSISKRERSARWERRLRRLGGKREPTATWPFRRNDPRTSKAVPRPWLNEDERGRRPVQGRVLDGADARRAERRHGALSAAPTRRGSVEHHWRRRYPLQQLHVDADLHRHRHRSEEAGSQLDEDERARSAAPNDGQLCVSPDAAAPARHALAGAPHAPPHERAARPWLDAVGAH